MTVNKTLKSSVRRKIAGVTLAEKLVRILGTEILTERKSEKKRAGKVGVTLSRNGMSRRELRNSVYWRSRLKHQTGEAFRTRVIRTREKEHEITLSTIEPNADKRVRYDFRSEKFELVPREDLLLDLLTLPSKSIHKDELPKSQEADCKDAALDLPSDVDHGEDLSQELMDLYGDRLTTDHLDDYERRNNPFNFSERVSQTAWRRSKVSWTQTEPPPSNTFSANVSFSVIYDAYVMDSEKVQEKVETPKAENEEQQVPRKGVGEDKTPQVSFSKVLVSFLGPKEEKKKRRTFRQEVTPKIGGHGGVLTLPITTPDISNLLTAARVMERMSCQLLGDEICQDYKFWDDDSDEYKALEGTLLPLWKFWCKNSRHYTVMDLCWHPLHADLIAVAYSADLSRAVASEGMCGTYLAAGTKDGSVLVFNLQKAGVSSSNNASAISGKHLLSVTQSSRDSNPRQTQNELSQTRPQNRPPFSSQVRWIPSEAELNPSFFSIAQDGRVSLWTVNAAGLSHINVLEFPPSDRVRKLNVNVDDKVRKGVPTSIAANPGDSDQFLVGLDTGAVVSHRRSANVHAIFSFQAHVGAVASITWNLFCQRVFATSSADWTVKVWMFDCFTPIIIVDLSSPVGGLAWASSNSTVFVAVTDDGRAHVFDISLRKTKALCTQAIRQGRWAHLSCVAFNPFEPVILVAGERGFILSLKLSPNLRKKHKDAKGADANTLKELEREKMERIIATSGILHSQ
ncbi:dynein intermediate chain 1, axonemal-like [Penaeus monodon]|uniref:dynein intermediate chain 1, axonemal-like n=1 Tax=Penaeus monodon TaxID=6687 RepID=UPI0018A788EE|nr:dynein intermediate chain 1, axonemal-like [Penaeus monodon]